MPNQRFDGRPGADPVSICLAGACAVHCLLTPVAVALLPVLGITLGNPLAEWGFILLSLGTSAYALAQGCLRSHRHWRALLPFIAGAAVLVSARLVDDSHPVVAAAAVVVGATGVISAHVLNIRWCRKAGAAQCASLPVSSTLRTPDSMPVRP